MNSQKRRMNTRNDGNLGRIARRKRPVAETSTRHLIPFCL